MTTVLLTIVGVLIFMVGLLVSIGLHEIGHMVPAKRFGVRVSQYMVGFGPTLWSRTRGETEYGLKAIPLGGYVRLVGMIPPEDEVKPVRGSGWAARLIADTRESSAEEVQEGEENRAFYRLSWWRKVIVMAGGPLMNLVLAVLIFTGVTAFHGFPQTQSLVSAVSACVIPADQDRTECLPSDPPAAAAAAGLLPGDRILAIDGRDVGEWEPLRDEIQSRPGETAVLTVQRGQRVFETTVTFTAALRPVYDDEGRPVLGEDGGPLYARAGFLGVTPASEVLRQNLGFGTELTLDYLGKTAEVVADLPSHVWHAARAALGLEERGRDGVVGIVGVARFAGEIASTDAAEYTVADRIADMLMLLGGLNLALFVFNMIPLLPLDGGHIAGALWQALKNAAARLRGRARPAPVDLARMMPLAYGVFGLLLVMGLVLIWADIVAPISV